jgi:hypothetical protein
LLNVRNSGRTAWPSGVLLAGGLVHDVPALGPGDSAIIRTERGKLLRDAPARMAMARTQADRVAALWELDPGELADVTTERKEWLLLTAPRP